MNPTAAYAAAQQAIATAVRLSPADALCTILTTAGVRHIVKREGAYLVVDADAAAVGRFGTLVAAHTWVHASA